MPNNVLLCRLLPSIPKKPDVRFYKKALNILGAQPTECIFIDDKEMNCIDAEKIGIKSIVFKHSEQLKKDLAALSIDIN